MTDPYRDMCNELVEQVQRAINDHGLCLEASDALMHRARALLDQPEPEVPTDEALMAVFWEHENGLEELWAADWPAAARSVLARWGNSTPQLEPEVPTDDELWALGNDDFRANYYPTDAIYYARAVLARWGNPTPQPVSVSERLPGPEDCDAGGMCWWWRSDGIEEFWELTCVPDPISHNSKCAENVSYGPWLPAHALPNPETTND